MLVVPTYIRCNCAIALWQGVSSGCQTGITPLVRLLAAEIDVQPAGVAAALREF